MVLEEVEMGTLNLSVRGLEEEDMEDVAWHTEGTLKTIPRLLMPTPRVSSGGTWVKGVDVRTL